jgi:hypothetical protein
MPTATALAPTGIPVPVPVEHDQLLWLAPSPLWEDGSIVATDAQIEQPHLVELTSDQFIPDFLAFLSGSDPAGEGPAGLGDHGPSAGSGTMTDPLVLYQPVHQRYYLVVGSLVCRRVGLPDRAVDPKRDQVSFVVRRLVDRAASDGTVSQVEQAWLPAHAGWVDVTDPSTLAVGEEQHPMQAAPVTAAISSGAAAPLLGLDELGRRELRYGYVPIAGRTSRPPTLTDDEALAALQASEPEPDAGNDPRLMAFRLRVAGAWSDMAGRKDTVDQLPGPLPPQFDRNQTNSYVLFEPSMFVLLDLLDWLGTYLPTVLDALIEETTLTGSDNADRETLRSALDIDILADGATKRLGDALLELQDYLPLLTGDEVEPPQTTRYDVTQGPSPSTAPLDTFANLSAFISSLAGSGNTDGGLVHKALVEEDDDPAGTGAPPQVPPELSGMIVARPADPAELDDRHVLRLVYQHEPCAPLLSKPSPIVRFAGAYDPDAPARRVRIQVPDPANLRRFQRGIAIEMPPNLRKILDGVTPKLLKEEPLGEGSDWGIGMICAFSFQIFFILSFIVAFIFLILLNLVFWWLPFIKICFPIPVKKSQGGP